MFFEPGDVLGTCHGSQLPRSMLDHGGGLGGGGAWVGVSSERVREIRNNVLVHTAR